VPNYGVHGMVIRHGEAFTLSDLLTVWENNKAVYRPTMHYAYCPCDGAVASLHELRGNDYRLQEKLRILNDDIIAGDDILGALIMGHPYSSWWTGSKLSIGESRKLVPHQNATTVQVAIGIVSAIMWMLKNPNMGVCLPEDLPHEFILSIAKPYLGKFISAPVDWTPLRHYTNAFLGYNNPSIDSSDPWQFKNFLITDGEQVGGWRGHEENKNGQPPEAKPLGMEQLEIKLAKRQAIKKGGPPYEAQEKPAKKRIAEMGALRKISKQQLAKELKPRPAQQPPADNPKPESTNGEE
jgi:hypothetical protein